jgi:hypothetical protein
MMRWMPPVQALRDFVQITGLDFDFEVEALGLEVFVGAVDGGRDAAGIIMVVVLDHDHVIEPEAVILSSADFDGPFFEVANERRGLACVEQFGVEPGKLRRPWYAVIVAMPLMRCMQFRARRSPVRMAWVWPSM